ncbi:MAG: MoxR family ATPase [Lachnospiraceae bacterium]|nr:MoxR family ATPase [Lachnospiraceae bacterium]
MQKTFDDIRANIGKVIVGKDEQIRLLLSALLAGGHVLLDDVPGTGKTMLAKALAKSVDGAFSRIQFTPDLLPSDVTGLNFFSQKEGEFVFKAGPVFANILLADEINRATPRTQSALLECMEEKQVTVDGETRALALPFFVIATQNPVETTGTFPLPEAQLDRFLMKLSMGTPTEEEELLILNRFLKDTPIETLSPVCTLADILAAQQEMKEVYVHPMLLGYITALAQQSRANSRVLAGVSPRGTLALLHASQAYAYVSGRTYVVPEDIKTLAIPVLAHRLVLDRAMGGRSAAKEVVEQLLESVPVPTEEWSKEFQ